MSFSSTNNNPSDFVSADVNEVLQDARQILTNREQRRDGQYPNELGESTTVQVTKQDSIEDPMEVTVMRKRKRLVEREEAETEDRVSEISTITTMDLPPSSRLPLPLELNCEIFKCLKLPIQRKFIGGLGRDIYGMFGQKLLKKTKRVRNPHGNRWDSTNTDATVAADGLNASKTNGGGNIYAEMGFPISGPQCRINEFPGTIMYYYEIKANEGFFGLSGAIADNDITWIGEYSNSYALVIGLPQRCKLVGEWHTYELPEGAIRPQMKENGNVFGCGIVLDPEDKLAIFFTLNGQLLSRKISISPTMDRLFPAFSFWGDSCIVANFGDDPAKPFEYDIINCPELELACI